MSDLERLAWLRSIRLRSQRLERPAESVSATVDHLLAIQAQEFWGGRWAISLRTKNSPSCSLIDRAFNRGTLVRSWTMRGTLHVVLARDLPWILEATREFQLRSRNSIMRSYGLSADDIARATDVVRAALETSGQLTRAQLNDLLVGAGLEGDGNYASVLISTLAIEGLIAQGPILARPNGITREQYFLLNENLKLAPTSPDYPLAELFIRYAIGHGPVRGEDFAWWAGIPKTDCRRAVEVASGDARLRVVEKFGEVYYLAARLPRSSENVPVTALPAFDEYFLGYKDRGHACDPQFMDRMGPLANGIVRPGLLVDGEIRGTWSHSRAVTARASAPDADWFELTHTASSQDTEQAFSRYTDFLG